MGLLDDLGNPQYRPMKGPRCSVPEAMELMDAATAAKFQAAMDNPAAPGTSIADALSELGYFVGADAIRRHRKGRCRCGK